MTVSIHRLPSTGWTAEERIRHAAHALSRMSADMASAIEVVGLDVDVDVLAASAQPIAAEFGLFAVIELEPTIVVRLTREP